MALYTVHRLEVTALEGCLKERLVLSSRLPAHSSAPQWLSQLEALMKTTLHTVMEACVLARLEEGKMNLNIERQCY